MQAVTYELLKELQDLAGELRNMLCMPQGAIQAYEDPWHCGHALDRLNEIRGKLPGHHQPAKTVQEALKDFFSQQALGRLFQVHNPWWAWHLVIWSVGCHHGGTVGNSYLLPMPLKIVDLAIDICSSGIREQLKKQPDVYMALEKKGIAGLNQAETLYLASIGGVFLYMKGPSDSPSVCLNGMFKSENDLLHEN